MDIFILVESSQSVGEENFNQIKESLVKLIETFEIGSNGVQVILNKLTLDSIYFYFYVVLRKNLSQQ